MREFFERLAQRLHGRYEANSQIGEVGLIFDFEHKADGQNRFARARCAVNDGYSLSFRTAMFNVFMFLLETLVNRLDRFVLIGRERLERRELKEVRVLELLDGMDCVVLFSELCPEVSELLSILRPLKIIELGVTIVGVGYLVFFVSAEQLDKPILKLKCRGLIECRVVDQKGPIEVLVNVCGVLLHAAPIIGRLTDVRRFVFAVSQDVENGPAFVMVRPWHWRAKILQRFTCLKGLGQGKRILPKGELVTHDGPPFCIRWSRCRWDSVRRCV